MGLQEVNHQPEPIRLQKCYLEQLGKSRILVKMRSDSCSKSLEATQVGTCFGAESFCATLSRAFLGHSTHRATPSLLNSVRKSLFHLESRFLGRQLHDIFFLFDSYGKQFAYSRVEVTLQKTLELGSTMIRSRGDLSFQVSEEECWILEPTVTCDCLCFSIALGLKGPDHCLMIHDSSM